MATIQLEHTREYEVVLNFTVGLNCCTGASSDRPPVLNHRSWRHMRLKRNKYSTSGASRLKVSLPETHLDLLRDEIKTRCHSKSEGRVYFVVLRMRSKPVRESKVIPYRIPLKLVPSLSSIRSGAACRYVDHTPPKRDAYEIHSLGRGASG